MVGCDGGVKPLKPCEDEGKGNDARLLALAGGVLAPTQMKYEIGRYC